MIRPISSLAALALTGILFTMPVGGQAPAAPAAAAPAGVTALPNGPSAQPGTSSQSGSSSDQDAAAVTTIRTFSNLVVIDVVVSDFPPRRPCED